MEESLYRCTDCAVFRMLRQFFEKLGFSKQAKTIQKIELGDLEEWYEKQTKPLMEQNASILRALYGRMRQDLASLKTSIEKLQFASVKDDVTVDYRTKQIVLGNRVNYIRELKQFYHAIIIPASPDFEEAQAFSLHLEQELNRLSASSYKGYLASGHLFFGEVSAITQILKSIIEAQKDLTAQMTSSNIISILALREKILHLRERSLQAEGEEQKLLYAKKTLENHITQKQQKSDRLGQLKSSPEFLELKLLISDYEKKQKQLSVKEGEIHSIFAKLERPLRKFKHVSIYEQHIDRYLGAPLEALIADTDLRILTILSMMKRRIEEGRLDFKDKEASKVIEVISTLTPTFMQRFLDEYRGLCHEREKTEKVIKSNPLKSEIELLSKEIENIQNNIVSTMRVIEDHEESIANAKFEKVKSDFEQDCKQYLDCQIEVV